MLLVIHYLLSGYLMPAFSCLYIVLANIPKRALLASCRLINKRGKEKNL